MMMMMMLKWLMSQQWEEVARRDDDDTVESVVGCRVMRTPSPTLDDLNHRVHRSKCVVVASFGWKGKGNYGIVHSVCG